MSQGQREVLGTLFSGHSCCALGVMRLWQDQACQCCLVDQEGASEALPLLEGLQAVSVCWEGCLLQWCSHWHAHTADRVSLRAEVGTRGESPLLDSEDQRRGAWREGWRLCQAEAQLRLQEAPGRARL